MRDDHRAFLGRGGELARRARQRTAATDTSDTRTLGRQRATRRARPVTPRARPCRPQRRCRRRHLLGRSAETVAAGDSPEIPKCGSKDPGTRGDVRQPIGADPPARRPDDLRWRPSEQIEGQRRALGVSRLDRNLVCAGAVASGTPLRSLRRDGAAQRDGVPLLRRRSRRGTRGEPLRLFRGWPGMGSSPRAGTAAPGRFYTRPARDGSIDLRGP